MAIRSRYVCDFFFFFMGNISVDLLKFSESETVRDPLLFRFSDCYFFRNLV